HFVSKFFRGNMKNLLQYGDGFAAIGPDHQSAVALHDFLTERATPEIANSVVDVVRIADAGDDSFRNVVQNIFKSIPFAVSSPRGNRGMLGSGNAVSSHLRTVVLLEQLDRGNVIRAEKIEKVRRAADGRGFTTADSAKSKIVQ